jgi:LysM repeat protein
MSQPIQWKGTQAVFVVGTEHEDNTLRIQPTQRYLEKILTLTLPTLCITYADMKFANSIGGKQRDYPDSKVYGPNFFDPPVTIYGQKEIEKFTYIRGADKLTIGKDVTVVEWSGWRELVIPKLRIKPKEKIKALLGIPQVTITVTEPFSVRIKQYADGRHVGGVEVIKRHPDWKPEPTPEEYKLWVRAIDGQSRQAIPRAKVTLYTWNEKLAGGSFVQEASWYTNEMGIAEASGLQCTDKKLVIIERKPWLPRTWRFHPYPGQEIRQTFKLWKGKETKIPGEGTGYEARYHVEKRDTLERIAEWFCYNRPQELAKANKLTKPFAIYPDQELLLPGWFFIQTKSAEEFESIDEKFHLPKGWSRPAQRTLHDNPKRAYKNEIIAVPTKTFTKKHKLKLLH